MDWAYSQAHYDSEFIVGNEEALKKLFVRHLAPPQLPLILQPPRLLDDYAKEEIARLLVVAETLEINDSKLKQDLEAVHQTLPENARALQVGVTVAGQDAEQEQEQEVELEQVREESDETHPDNSRSANHAMRSFERTLVHPITQRMVAMVNEIVSNNVHVHSLTASSRFLKSIEGQKANVWDELRKQSTLGEVPEPILGYS